MRMYRPMETREAHARANTQHDDRITPLAIGQAADTVMISLVTGHNRYRPPQWAVEVTSRTSPSDLPPRRSQATVTPSGRRISSHVTYSCRSSPRPIRYRLPGGLLYHRSEASPSIAATVPIRRWRPFSHHINWILVIPPSTITK